MITAILPVWNAEQTIQRAVRSALSQSFHDFELLVVNDGSMDATGTLLEQLALSDSRIRIISKNHSGVADAFNAGLRESKGKYIARMDADDEMHPERLEKQATFLDEHPHIGVVSCLVKHGGDVKSQEGYLRHIDWLNTLVTPEQIALNRFIDSPVCNPSVMFRRELVAQHGDCLHGDFPEDYEMWLRWIEGGVLFEKFPRYFFTWNDLWTRLTRNDARYSVEAFERVKKKYLVNYIRTNNPEQRPLYLCGTGRITRKKSIFLAKSGLPIGGYLDVDVTKIGLKYDEVPVIGIDELPDPSKAFVVSYIGVRGVREEIRAMLEGKGFVEGRDFVMAG